MRVYHFVARDYGLEDIRKRRIKIATIADVNDPFELVPSSRDQIVRQRFRMWRWQFDRQFGMLCFSRSWRNPVQWSHYAAKHTGPVPRLRHPDEPAHQGAVQLQETASAGRGYRRRPPERAEGDA